LVCDDRLLQDGVAHQCCSRGSRTPTHADSHAYSYSNSYSYGYCYGNSYAYADSYAYCYSNSYCYRDRDSDSDIYPNSKAYSDSQAQSHIEAAPNSGAAAIGCRDKSNQIENVVPSTLERIIIFGETDPNSAIFVACSRKFQKSFCVCRDCVREITPAPTLARLINQKDPALCQR